MKRNLIILTLILLLGTSFLPVFGEGEKPGMGEQLPGEKKPPIKAEESRNFLAWWGDHSGYLITPRTFDYNHLSDTRENILNLLLLVGYKGVFEEVVHAQAIHELKNIVTATKSLGKIVSGEIKFTDSELPKGVRQENVQCFAAMALGELGDREALPNLKKGLDSGSISLKAFCAVAIGKLGGIGYREDLLKEFSETPRGRDPHLRSAYLASLAYLADPMVLPDLIEGLQDRDPRVRLNLVTVFGRMAVKNGSSVIGHYRLQYANHESVRLGALWATAKMGRREASKGITQRYPNDLSAVKKSLMHYLTYENVPLISDHTFFALGYLGTPWAKETLNSFLNSSSKNDRMGALYGLAIMGEYPECPEITDPDFRDSIDAIAQAKSILEQKNPDVFQFYKLIRELSISSNDTAASCLLLMLANSYSPSKMNIIERTLNSGSPTLVKTALIASGMVSSNVDIVKACSMLQAHILSNPLPNRKSFDSNEKMEIKELEKQVSLAYVSLGMLNTDRALPFLMKKMKTQPGYEGVFAAISLAVTGGLCYRTPLYSTMIDSGNSVQIRSASAFSLGLTDAPGVVESLIDTIKRETDVDVRAHAILALAIRGHQESIPVLYSILNDSRLSRSADGNYLKGCAALALSQCNPQPYYFIRLKQLMEESDNSNFRSFAALALGLSKQPEMVESLVPLLSDSSFSVRCAACMGIGLSGCKEYLEDLRNVIKTSSHSWTRVQAAIGSGLLGDLSAESFLLKSLDPKNEGISDVRVAASLGLMLLGHKSANTIKCLKDTEGDPDPKVGRYAAIARFVLGDKSGLEVFIKNTTAGGIRFQKLDGDIIKFWANQSLPKFFKLRSYLFDSM